VSARLTPEIVEILRRSDVLLYVATTNPDGSPHVAPVWSDADLERNLVLFNTAEGRRKVRNLRRDPRVALAAHLPERPSPALLIEGEAERFTTEGALEHIDALSRRYDGEPWTPVEGQTRLIVEVRPVRILAST
jgi:PPOX class probable F420-dependent enzyme